MQNDKLTDTTQSTIRSAEDALKDGDASAPNAAATPVAAANSLDGVRVFVASMAKIGTVINDEAGETVQVRLSADANDPTAPVATVNRVDCVRNTAL